MAQNTVYLIANGDLRQSANQNCEAAQQEMEKALFQAFEASGAILKRAHPYDPAKGHSFIDSQSYGMAVFRSIPEDAPLVIAEAVWQYTHHVLHGLLSHRGPILSVANWSGTWPGLVGMLNLNGSMTKAGVKYSTLWSETFKDETFLHGLRSWLGGGQVTHDSSHVRAFQSSAQHEDQERIGIEFAKKFKSEKRIIGVFDEGCMGMYNAVVPDELLQTTGIFKERLSQSALYYESTQVRDAEARAVLDWYRSKGMRFNFGKNERTDLTESQVLTQCKTYIAAVRIADDFGCHAIGIQYQQGLKDLLPASDLIEGTLNNQDRPPVKSRDGKRTLYAGEALPHFNEVDECAALDGLLTYELWKKLGQPPENTLHDVRWGRHYNGLGRRADGETQIDDYVWVFEISGAAPPAHFIGGWSGASSERQPEMYFRLGGGTLKGISRPGWVVWSRVFLQSGTMHYDTGLAEVVELPAAETEERLRLTTPQWPIMHAVLKGISRDQFMGRHKSNHIQCVYATSREKGVQCLRAKAAAMAELGLNVAMCGQCD